ncbi:MAG: ABC transporter ATP-binding protein [Acidimicrobiia bacterium]|nr:ABC transporter ATP-binding protein [Acidimicrobiia bacterium]MDH3470389.1 ABC transporter ATP-binding protein [Acidimicrobiia bacterium]
MTLELRRVSKLYGQGGVGARSVDLTVRAGEMVALFGPSGSGKTSLLQLMGLLVKPDEGEVLLDGNRIDTLDESGAAEIRKKRLGFVFQSFGLLSLLSAEENVEVALRLLGVGGRTGKSQVASALELVGLSERTRHRPDELSGGEQQRVALARAIVHSPDYLLADEPTGELDTDTGTAILRLMKQIASGGSAVVVATHDPKVLDHADRSLFVRDGTLHTPDRSELTLWATEGTGGLSSS